MKKWLAAILLIISVACSVVPCCQFDDCAAEEIEAGTTNHENEEEGNCSPFFSCTTCSGFAEITKPIQLNEITVQKQTHYSKTIIFYRSDYETSFWQPPRLA